MNVPGSKQNFADCKFWNLSIFLLPLKNDEELKEDALAQQRSQKIQITFIYFTVMLMSRKVRNIFV